jgi:hypothetical protein
LIKQIQWVIAVHKFCAPQYFAIAENYEENLGKLAVAITL